MRSRKSSSTRAYNRAYHARRSPEKKLRKLDLQRERKRANQLVVKNYLLTHTCVDCPEKDPVVMEFDHVSDDKITEVSTGINKGWAMTKIVAEIAKCEVVCANCHRRRTHRRRLLGMA